MARFNSYARKQKPDSTDTVLIYDDDESPDTLKQVRLGDLIEELESVYGNQTMTIKEAIEALLNGAGIARYS